MTSSANDIKDNKFYLIIDKSIQLRYPALQRLK
jgi:hypothetical protein